MTGRILTTPQTTDPGTEGNIGFDYQKELAVWLCICMLEDREMENVVCEFHEDIVQIRKGLKLELIQVKQTQSKIWTLSNIIKPAKKQKKGILGKLFESMQKGKDVTRLAFWGYGKASTAKKDGDLSLAKLIALLRMPEEGKDEEWVLDLEEYINYLSEKLEAQGIAPNTVRNGINKLDINLDFPHPDAIEHECCNKLREVLSSTWSIQLSHDQVEIIYNDIYSRVKKISRKPKQDWSIKAISKVDVKEIILRRAKEYYPISTLEEAFTTQEKLTNVDLSQKIKYALVKRLEAMVLKYEIPINPSTWQIMKTDIDIELRQYYRDNPKSIGSVLWKSMLQVFSEIGQVWTDRYKDRRLGAEFVEGVFFDMTGVCEAKWMRMSRDK